MKKFMKLIITLSLVFIGTPLFTEDPPVPGDRDLRGSIDRATVRILQKPAAVTHPAFIEVDRDAFARNIQSVKKMIGRDTMICLVLKSDAYGHGLENLMPAVLASRPDYIALVENGEIAIAVKMIRKSGRNIPILRIAPATMEEAVEAVVKKWNVEELVGSVEQGALLSSVSARLAQKTGIPVNIPVHININTGMGRMGVETAGDIKKILSLPGLTMKGIMTHFAQSDDETKKGETRTREQLKKFDEILSRLDISKKVILHVANSAATSKFPWARKKMVRVGSLIYGDVTRDTDPGGIFLPVMKSFRTSVAIILHDVPPGTTVGYDSIFKTRSGKKSTLATVKVGYNNGYPRDAYVNRTEVLIGGKRFPVVGKVSMNLTVIDITDQDAGRPILIGDEVVLLGWQGKERITMEELAVRNKTTTYELLLRLGNNNHKKVALPTGGP